MSPSIAVTAVADSPPTVQVRRVQAGQQYRVVEVDGERGRGGRERLSVRRRHVSTSNAGSPPVWPRDLQYVLAVMPCREDPHVYVPAGGCRMSQLGVAAVGAAVVVAGHQRAAGVVQLDGRVQQVLELIRPVGGRAGGDLQRVAGVDRDLVVVAPVADQGQRRRPGSAGRR